MSTSLFPPLPPVGGFVTQQVLMSIPMDKSHSMKYKQNCKTVFIDKQFSQQGFSPTNLKPGDIIDTAK